MNVRPATEADAPVLRELWEEFEAEVPAPPELQESWEEEWQDVAADIGGRGAVFLAENDGGVAGAVRATLRAGGAWHIAFAHVRPHARRRGVLKSLLVAAIAEGRQRGCSRVTLDVLTSNEIGLAVWNRLGFEPELYYMTAPLESLDERVQRKQEPPSEGSVYVQTDDLAAVERAVRQFVPRLGRSERTDVHRPRNGWIRIDDELCSREPKLLRRLAREVSDRMGAVVLSLGVEREAVVRFILFDRGRIADEYASVPEYYGPLPPGDVVGLGANPTVVQRLTGADPARVRAVARTGSSVAELPPPRELVAELADVFGVASEVAR